MGQHPTWITRYPIAEDDWSYSTQTLEDHSGPINAVAFSHDGKQLASCSDDGTVGLWDTATGVLHGTLEGHSGWVRAVAFSHDGKQLASCSDDGTVRLWDPATGALCVTLEGHLGWVNAVAFSHDGKQLASCSDDQTVRLWDPARRRLLQMFNVEDVDKLIFSVDGSDIQTNCGQIQLTNEPGHTQSRPSLSSSWIKNQNWLIQNSCKGLWLFPDFRPSCLTNYGHLFVIRHGSGRISFLKLDPSVEQLK
jgi:WD40 repeat protein